MSISGAGPLIQLICTPIGNLGDFTFRAVECLKRANLICCEDTRHSRRLLDHYGITGKTLLSLHDHNEERKSVELTEKLITSNETLAVLSDAGSPSISDPGFRLVKEAVSRGIRIEVIPGPSAVITGLVGSGLPTDQFSFHGFLPVKSGKKQKALEAALNSAGTSIFFESPYRILKTLNVIDALDSERNVCVAREITKRFETYHRGTAAEIIAEFGESTVKGEITLVIEGLSRKMRRDASD